MFGKAFWISGVCASLVASFIFELKPWVWGVEWLTSLLTWFKSSVTISVWGLILSFTIPFIIFVIIKNIDSELHWDDYKQDNFFGVRWHWHWGSYGNGIQSLFPLCPNCMYELSEIESVYMRESTGLQCEKCGFCKDFSINISDLLERVKKEIRRKIRTGEYMKTLKLKSVNQNEMD